MIAERITVSYTPLEEQVINLRRQDILNEIDILKLSSRSIIYDNQTAIAIDVANSFRNKRIINVMVLAKTQSGKTGSMCATIKEYLEDEDNSIPIENIYIITGHSSVEWKSQTIDRMPDCLHVRVYHRAELPTTFSLELKEKKNVLIIWTRSRSQPEKTRHY